MEKQCASKNTLNLGLGIAAAHHLMLVETSSMFHPTEAVRGEDCLDADIACRAARMACMHACMRRQRIEQPLTQPRHDRLP